MAVGVEVGTRTVEAGRSRAELRLEPVNRRITVTDCELAGDDLPALCEAVMGLARREAAGKVAWWARASEWLGLLGQGFVLEAVVPCFLRGEKGFFLARFTEEERRQTDRFVREDRIVDEVTAEEADAEAERPAGYQVVPWEAVEAAELRRFYAGIFASYPTPLTEPGFIERLLAEGRVVGRAALDGGRIISSAAVELDRPRAHGEVTDCATEAAHRGKGLNRFLIAELEPEAWRRGCGCLYAMARARSFGMNLVLHRLKYAFGGRLVNHSHIAGQLEDMNVWYKTAAD